MVTHTAMLGQHLLLASESPVCMDQQLRKARKLTNKEDPMSHRIIEKRRRDRMNNCLADLSRLIPADYLKKGRGRIEKTEIIEMAIKHMKHLQTRSPKPADCDLDCDPTAPEEDRPDLPSGPPHIDTEHYRLGYQECLSEAMHFMVEVEGFYAGDPLCVQLINHLQKHCDKILKGDRLNCPRAHVNETTSNSSGSSGSYPHHPHHHHHSSSSSSDRRNGDDRSARTDETYDEEDQVVDLTGGPSRLRDMLTAPAPTAPTASAASLYKFKNNIKQRFSAEHRDDASLLKRRRFEPPPPGEPTRRHSDTCSIPSSPPPSPSPPSPNVPIFALHARGSYYVPLTLDADVLTPYFDELDIADDSSSGRQGSDAAATLVLHPVTISVNFKHSSSSHKMEARPGRALGSWKNDSSGFVPLSNWFQAATDRHTLTIPPYSKHV